MSIIRITGNFCAYSHNGGATKYGAIHTAFKNIEPGTSINIVAQFLTIEEARNFVIPLKKKEKKGRPMKPVMVEGVLGCRVYRSMSMAAMATDLAYQTVSNALNGRPGFETPGGFSFMRFSPDLILDDDYCDPLMDRSELRRRRAIIGNGVPGSINAMTPEEQENARKEAIAKGFNPRF